MKEFMAKFLGNDLTKWVRLKIAVGVASDEDLLSILINFYAEAKGISLTEPQLPPLPAAAPRPTVRVQVRPVADRTTPSSFIVIHQDEPSSLGRDPFSMENNLGESAQSKQKSRNSFPMLMLRADEEDEEDNGEEKCDVWGDVSSQEFHEVPVEEAKGIYLREQAKPAVASRCTVRQDEHDRALDGMLWREAVLRGRPMPPQDVSCVWSSGRPPLMPTLLPWRDPAPVRELPIEAPVLREIGCTLCGKMGFGSRMELITHFWLQHPETRERTPTQYLASKREPDFAHCSLCTLIGAVEPAAKHNRLVPHMARAHMACQLASAEAAHTCDVCHAELASEAARDEHVAAAHPEHEPLRYVCVLCAKVQRGQQAYIRHLRIHFTEYVYACNICPNFRSRDPETMAAHTAAHERRTFRCGRCPFLTRTFRTVVDHLRTHLQLPRYICPVCGYRAYTSSRYFNHMDSHGGRRHRCEICSEEFNSLLNKSYHKILVHRRPAKFTCDRCGIVFRSGGRLRRHQATHTGHKAFTCQLCGKGLSSRQSLQNHMRICAENDEVPRWPGAFAELLAT